MGLYTGISGIAYTVRLVAAASRDAVLVREADRLHALVLSAAREVGKGVEWNESTDIVSGSAGIGLYLLWASGRVTSRDELRVAAAAGRRLIERGEAVNGGVRWLIQPSMQRNYPNFSHGTAGVSFFLATLYGATRERAFLDVARQGAAYLDGLMTATPNGGRAVYHSTPGNESIYYLSWCHGPAGTSRLYHRLGQVTGDDTFTERVGQLARATVDLGVPQRSAGFWNNISQCCGNSGVVEFFLDLYRKDRKREQLEFAERVAQDTLHRGTESGGAIRWIQAEHRVQPDLLVAQTGFMQGAAGVGVAMLHLDGAISGREPQVILPDNPFQA
jgi:lantibiotic modifying enzyme